MLEGVFQPMHLLVIFFIALLVFGPKKLPELGKGIGAGIRALKEGLKDPLIEPAKSVSAEPGPSSVEINGRPTLCLCSAVCWTQARGVTNRVALSIGGQGQRQRILLALGNTWTKGNLKSRFIWKMTCKPVGVTADANWRSCSDGAGDTVTYEVVTFC